VAAAGAGRGRKTMSYNIDRIHIISQEGFGIFVVDLPDMNEDDAPGAWEDFEDWPVDDAGFATPNTEYFPWSGEWSGRAFDFLRSKLLPQFKGRADLVLTWERADYFNGLRINHGRVTEHEVIMTLGKEKGS
jgi:hypothetical protein